MRRRSIRDWKSFSGENHVAKAVVKMTYDSYDSIPHSFALLSFVAIVAFSTFFHVYVIYTAKNGKLRKDVLVEEIVKSFSIICKFTRLPREEL